MTKFVPIWLRDKHGNSYHAKVSADGECYIVDAFLNKSLTITRLRECQVGHKIDYSWFYNEYEVTRNDLLESPNEPV